MFRSRKPPEAVGADESQRIERAAAALGLGRPEWHPDRVRFTGRGRERSVALPALLSALRLPDADRGATPDLLALAGLTGVAPPPETLADFSTVRTAIRPRLLHSSVLAGPRRAMCRREVWGGLLQAIALGPDANAPLLTSAVLDQWPLTFEEVTAAGLENLRLALGADALFDIEDTPGIVAAAHPRELVAAGAMLIPELIPGADPDSGVIASIPASNALLLARVNPGQGVSVLASLVDATMGLFSQADDPLFDQLLWWRRGKTVQLPMTFVEEGDARRVQIEAQGEVGELLRILGALD